MQSSKEKQGEGKKKTFLSEQCKDRGKHRMGQTNDLFKKIRDTIRYQREHFMQGWAQ